MFNLKSSNFLSALKIHTMHQFKGPASKRSYLKGHVTINIRQTLAYQTPLTMRIH
jgi:hypothetical protein